MQNEDEEDERAKFERVVGPFLDDALRLARWLTRNRSDAEDIVQESCLRAFRSIGQFRGVNARSWILAIVRNTASTWIRKNRSTSLVFVDDRNVVVTVFGEYRHELDDVSIRARDSHVRRHDLADDFRFGRVHRRRLLEQSMQAIANATVHFDVRVSHEIRERHDTENAHVTIDDRQRLDPVATHQRPCFVQRRRVLRSH